MNNESINNSKRDPIKEFLITRKPMLIEVRADWCGGSHIIAPIIKKIEQDFKKKITIERIDYESNKDFLIQCGVKDVPSIILVKDGNIFKMIAGTPSKRNLEKLLGDLLNNNNHTVNS